MATLHLCISATKGIVNLGDHHLSKNYNVQKQDFFLLFTDKGLC